jgi:sugar transferase EpsL
VLLLLLLSPVLLAVAVWIVVTDGRPVLFVQPRTGLGGTPFAMYKFRTMVPDAIALGLRAGLQDPYGLVVDDPRITRTGRVLRRTGLDELPQLFNVVKGDMSLVGPRPDVPEQSAHYTERERGRLAVRPGITGWAQVNGRENVTWTERFDLDLWYVEHRSTLLDIGILLRTLGQVGRPEPVVHVDELNVARRQAHRLGS